MTQGNAGSPVKLGVVDVTDARHIMKLGHDVMTVTGPDALVPASPDTRVLQGQLEASAVDPMVEMVNMLEGQRAFEANARMISYQDSTMAQLNMVGRVA
jgi:flagellar basal-body rod protein FlgF